MTITITQEHLDRAIAAKQGPDYTLLRDCVLAQALADQTDYMVKRTTITGPYQWLGWHGLSYDSAIRMKIVRIVDAFDAEQYGEVAAMLPFSFKVSDTYAAPAN